MRPHPKPGVEKVGCRKGFQNAVLADFVAGTRDSSQSPSTLGNHPQPARRLARLDDGSYRLRVGLSQSVLVRRGKNKGSR